MVRGIGATLLLGLLWSQPGAAQDAPPPEAPNGWAGRAAVTTQRYMIVTANPLASDAGAVRGG